MAAALPSDVELLKVMERNKENQRIGRKLSLRGAYVLVRGRVQIKTGKEPGLVWLSPVAFSPDKRHAMVYVTNYCGPLYASGSLWKLDRDSTGWRVSSDAICGYVS